MKLLTLLPIAIGMLLSFSLSAATWYVSPTGNDANPGTFAAPFRTWQKGHDVTLPGDTVWLRGGTYLLTTPNLYGVHMSGHNGLPGNRIYFWAYPGETPILDCSGMTSTAQIRGILFENDWWHLKGLEIRNVPMNAPTVAPVGWWGQDCENNIFERLDVHHGEGRGFSLYENSKNNLVLNCDFHHNYDPETAGDPGGNADGGGFNFLTQQGTGNVIRGCRAWSNSDDGFDFFDSEAPVTVENCWSFRNGYIPNTNTPAGNGQGFKMGMNQLGQSHHAVHNCLAFYNRSDGFTDNSSYQQQYWYNNTAFNNGGFGFHIIPFAGAFWLRNNISVPNSVSLNAETDQAFNSWNLPVTANAADFVSTDTSACDSPRNADGSLPTLNFLKLAPGSDLIDQGTLAGLPFNGNAPDLGAYETAASGGQLVYPASFQPRGFGGGGYMYSPSISPHDPNLMFIVCDMGGVYRSQDGGLTWAMFGYPNLVSTVKGKVQFTSNPNVLYVVRRDMTNAADPWWRGELAKSLDGGQSWFQIADPTSSGVHRIEVDPNSTERILLTEYNALFFSNDGGEGWTEVFHPAEDQMWLGGAFWDGQNIFVGTNKGLLVSTNGGQSFALETHAGLPAGAGIYHLAGAKASGTTRLFCIPAPASELYAWSEPLGLKGSLQGFFRMNYAANAAWTDTRGNIPANVEIAWTDLAKNNTQTVWADGNEPDDFPHTYKSTDGGLTWANTFQVVGNQNVSTGWTGSAGAFWLEHTGAALGFDVSDNDPNLVLRTHGQAEKTSDGGTTWKEASVLTAYLNPANSPTSVSAFYKSSGLDVTTTHHLFWRSQNEIYACNTDVGQTFSQNGGDIWTFARNIFQPWGVVKWGNWYRMLRRPDNNHLFAAVSQINDIYLGYRTSDDEINGGGEVVRSTDNGQTWTTMHDFGFPVVWLELDKTNSNRLFASVVDYPDGGIFRSDNGGTTWTHLPNPPRTEGHPYNILSLADGSLVVTYSARRLPDGTLTESAGVFYSTDGGNTWLDRTANAMKFYTKDLVVDPHDPTQNTWYATVWGRYSTWPGVNNQGNGGIYKTTNRGVTWVRIYAREMTESLTISPSVSGRAYVTVENEGLFFTENLGAATPTFQRVNSYGWWRPKRVFFNPYNPCEVWVTSMGGGIWKGSETAAVAGIAATPGNYCQGASTALTASGGTGYLWSTGQTDPTIYVHPNVPTTYSVTITGAAGCIAAPPSVTLDPLSQSPTLLSANSASFTDGSGSSNYWDMTDCRWLIQPPGATSITLNFSAFQTEQDWDFVRIYNGNSTAAPLLGAYSGSNLPPQLTSTGGSMLVQFESDLYVNEPGWAAGYTSQGCVADLTVSGNPISPGVYRASNAVFSAGKVGASTLVEFHAINAVELLAGFEVVLGGTFLAETGNCCQ